MADAVGAVSLTLQLLDGCIRGKYSQLGYKFLEAVVHMSESCAERRMNLILEYNLLISWATETGLLQKPPPKTVEDSLGISVLDTAAVLSEIRTVLETIGRLNGRYEELQSITIDQDERAELDGDQVKDIFAEAPSMLLIPDERSDAKENSWSLAYKFLSSLGEVLKHPKRFRWVCLDEKRFDEALKRLHYYTSRLRALTGDSRLRAIQDRTEAIFMEVVQATQTQKELAGLVRGVLLLLADSRTGETRPDFGANHELGMLRDLASLKELKIASTMGNLIPRAQITYFSTEHEHDITKATYDEHVGMTEANQELSAVKSRVVWIEWKGYGPEDLKTNLQLSKGQANTMRSNIEARTAQLAKLLSYPKPVDFCTPTCLGFFEEPENHRFAWVFDTPSQTTGGPKRLRSLFSPVSRPSLTERVALACRLSACLLYLHSVDWLHKAFRSDNILFFYDGDAPDMSDPIVSGFDLSRPDGGKTVENPKATAARDLYCWPTSQTSSQHEHSWRKTFDIYSLGIVLIEIAHWQPVETVMELGDVSEVTTSQCLKIQSQLLHTKPKYLAKVLELMGRRYHDAVKACIQGHEGFGLEEHDDQTDPDVAIKLQRKYREKVVMELKGMNV
ncbi:hypothetical protein FDECE_4062 [Fusarium decemcellulare]|nr:hypothetical protein FDECE_4062 [Fusarium decemcellulare]